MLWQPPACRRLVLWRPWRSTHMDCGTEGTAEGEALRRSVTQTWNSVNQLQQMQISKSRQLLMNALTSYYNFIYRHLQYSNRHYHNSHLQKACELGIISTLQIRKLNVKRKKSESLKRIQLKCTTRSLTCHKYQITNYFGEIRVTWILAKSI